MVSKNMLNIHQIYQPVSEHSIMYSFAAGRPDKKGSINSQAHSLKEMSL